MRGPVKSDGKQHRKTKAAIIESMHIPYPRHIEDAFGKTLYVPRLMEMPITCNLLDAEFMSPRIAIDFMWKGHLEHAGIYGFMGINIDSVIVCMAKRLSCLEFNQDLIEKQLPIPSRRICKAIINDWRTDPNRQKWYEPVTELILISEVLNS
jgi:hypothetical protein